MSEPIRSSGRLPIPRAAKKAKRGEGKLVVYQALRAVHDENVAEGLPDTEAAERTTLSVPLGTRLDRYRAKVDRRRYSERAR